MSILTMAPNASASQSNGMSWSLFSLHSLQVMSPSLSSVYGSGPGWRCDLRHEVI